MRLTISVSFQTGVFRTRQRDFKKPVFTVETWPVASWVPDLLHGTSTVGVRGVLDEGTTI